MSETAAPKPTDSAGRAAAGSSGPSEAELLYQKGSKVYCYHGRIPYEAKILETDPEREFEGVKCPYKIHYQGWNIRHDEWVNPSRLLMDTDETRALAKKEEETPTAIKSRKRKLRATTKEKTPGRDGASSRASTPSVDSKQPKSSRASTTSDPSGPVEKRRDHCGQKAGVEAEVESEREFGSRPEVRIGIPDGLKTLLVDDWDLVTRQYKLVNLQQLQITVAGIVDEYIKTKRGRTGTPLTAKQSQLVESATGVRAYFDAMLGTQLLYKFERAQYKRVCEERAGTEWRASNVYGYVHLLRLFVRIGTMLAYTSWSERSISILVGHLQDFVAFLQKHQHWFQPGDYETASPEYQKQAFLT